MLDIPFLYVWINILSKKDFTLIQPNMKVVNFTFVSDTGHIIKIDFKNKLNGADSLKVDRDYFYELVDKIPKEKLEELRIVLLKMAIPEVEATPEELEAIGRGKEEIERGEFVSYNSFEELVKDIMND